MLFKYSVLDQDNKTRYYAVTFDNIHHFNVLDTNQKLVYSKYDLKYRYSYQTGYSDCFRSTDGDSMLLTYTDGKVLLRFYDDPDNLKVGLVGFSYREQIGNNLLFKNEYINKTYTLVRVVPTVGFVSTDNVNFKSMTTDETFKLNTTKSLGIPLLIAQSGVQL